MKDKLNDWIYDIKNKLIVLLNGVTPANHEYVRFYYLGEMKKLRAKISTLEVDLDKAKRNDSPKDPKTGRFKKKAK